MIFSAPRRLGAALVLSALLLSGEARQARADDPAAPAADGVAPIEVWLVAPDGSRSQLTGSRARVAKAEVAGEGGPSISQQIAQTIVQMIPVIGPFFSYAKMMQQQQGSEVRFIYALPGIRSATEVRTPLPSFEIVYDAVAGMSLDSARPVFVRLTPYKTYYRVTGITVSYDLKAGNAAMHGHPVDAAPPNNEVRIGARLGTPAPGRAAIAPERPLDPGEYAITFRAASGSLDPALAFSMWDFRVEDAAAPATPPPPSVPPTASPPTVAPSG